MENEEISEKKIIDENTESTYSWVNLPKKDEIGTETDEMIISEQGYYTQDGREFLNKKTNKKFYSGLTDKTGARIGEYIVSGTINGADSNIRINNWELVFKMSRLVKHCREVGETLAGQKIKFKRVSSGTENAGRIWELISPSLKIKIVGNNNEIQKIK